VRTSQEAGLIYTFQDPVLGENVFKIADNLNKRFLWIWNHDLDKDVKDAIDEFYRLVGPVKEGLLKSWLRKSGFCQ